MLVYKTHINGVVYDTESDFEVGFDITVTNGGDLITTGCILQDAIERMRGNHSYRINMN